MSDPFFIARDKTPLLAPIRRSRDPIVIPSFITKSFILERIASIRVTIIPFIFVKLKNINYVCFCIKKISILVQIESVENIQFFNLYCKWETPTN